MAAEWIVGIPVNDSLRTLGKKSWILNTVSTTEKLQCCVCLTAPDRQLLRYNHHQQGKDPAVI